MSARSAPLGLSASLFAVVAWLVALPLLGVAWGIFWTASLAIRADISAC